MPELLVPRSNLGFPSVCVLTGDTEDVRPHEVVLDKRSGALWGALGFVFLVALGWIGDQLSQHFMGRCPMTLPFSRRGYHRWRRAQGMVFGAFTIAIVLLWIALRIFTRAPIPFVVVPSRVIAWVCLVTAIVMPAVAYRLLLWNKQPWFCESQGLIMILWIPSAAAADAIHAHMKPLLDRAMGQKAERGKPSVGESR